MKIEIKILRPLLESVRMDLERPHPFAFERVGFLIAAPATARKGVLLNVCGYQPVADEDYENNESVYEKGSRSRVSSTTRPVACARTWREWPPFF